MSVQKKLFIFIAPILFGAATTASAMDLMASYKLAVEQDPQLRAAHYKHDATKETLRQAWAKFLPVATADAEFGQNFQDVISSEVKVYSKDTTDFFSKQYSAQITQPLFHLENFHTLAQAKATLNKADMEQLMEEQDLIARTTVIYFGILAAQDTLKSTKAEESALARHCTLAMEKSSNGLIALTELYDAQARLDGIKADRIEAERILDTSIQAFMEITGVPVADINTMKTVFPIMNPDPDDVEKWVATGHIKNLPLIIKRFEAIAFSEEVGRQESGHYPTLDLVTKWNRNDAGGSLYGGASDVNTFQVLGRLTVPLYSGGMTSSKVTEAIALYRKASQEIIKQDRLAVRQIRDFYHGMKSSANRVAALAKSIKSQTLVLDAKERGYKSGLYDTLSVLDALKELSLSQKNYAKARYDYVVNSVKLKQAAGILTIDDIKIINSWLN